MGPPPPPGVEATFRLTLGDVFRASAEAARHSWLATVFGFLFLYGTFFAVTEFDVTAIAFIVVGLGFSTGWLSAAFVVFGASRRPDLLARDHHFHADAGGLGWTSPDSSSRTAWRTFKRVREMRADFLLDVGTGSSTFVPKAGLGPAGTALFRELARQQGVLATGSSWARPVVGYVLGAMACVVLWVGTSTATR